MAQNRPAAGAHVAAAANTAGGAPNAPNARPSVMPEAYTGQGDWLEYLEYFNLCAAVNQWNDAQRAQFLAVRLRDGAQQFLGSVPAARRAVWADLVAGLTDRFAPAGAARQYKAQFHTRRRRANEDFGTLRDELHKLVGRAYPTMQPALQDELVRDQFLDAVTPERLRIRLHENAPQTVQAAVELATHLERAWERDEVDKTSRLLQTGDTDRLQLVTTAVEPKPPTHSRVYSRTNFQPVTVQ